MGADVLGDHDGNRDRLIACYDTRTGDQSVSLGAAVA